MKPVIKKYFACLRKFAGRRLVSLALVALVSSAMEGAVLLLLVPLLYIARSFAGPMPVDIPVSINFLDRFADKNSALAAVLCLFAAMSIAQEYFKRKLSIITTEVRTEFNLRLSTGLYDAFANAKWSALLSRRRSDIANALSNELKMIDMGTQIFLQLAPAIPMLIVQIGICAVISPEGTLAAIVVGALFFIFLMPVNRKLGNFSESLNSLLKDSLSDVHEHLSGIKEVKSYGAEQVHIERFAEKNRGMQRSYIEFVKLFTQSSFIYNSGTFVLVALFVFMSLTVFNEGIARLIILFIVFLRVWPVFSGLQASLQMLMLAFPAWDSFCRCLDDLQVEREEYFADPKTRPLTLKKGIEMRGVTYSYSEGQQNAIEDVCLSIPAYSNIAITGPSGSGKSTLVDIVNGLLVPARGEVLIDGAPLGPKMMPAWRMAIGFVPQETFLFRGTIRENLLWAHPSAGDEDVWRALDTAAASDFVKDLPLGLDTQLGDRGARLSVGQRQRIALARAILRSPALLIMDEATSSIDVENERRIQSAIEGLRGKMTILTIAHRLSTIQSADKIALLDRGRIVEEGSFSELIERAGGRFACLAGESR